MFSSMKGTSLDLNAIPRVSSTVKNCCYGLNVEKNLVQESICEEKQDFFFFLLGDTVKLVLQSQKKLQKNQTKTGGK